MHACAVAPTITSATPTTPTSITLMWTQSGSAVDSYMISYNYTIRRCGTGAIPGSESVGNGGVRSFTLLGLEEDSVYTLTLTAVRGATQAVSNVVSTTTNTAGKLFFYSYS